MLAVGAAAVGVVQLTSTSSRTARVSSSARPHQVRPSRSAAAAGSAAVAASVRSQAAAWIAGQVSSAATIGCDPLMCAALTAHGVAAGRLLPLGPAASSVPGADVIAASPLSRTGLGQEAPALLASFGSGGGLIEVRAASPGGPASYQAALAGDVAARRSAGAQLLHSRRIEVGAQGTGQIQAGQVDSRLLIMLAVLASQRSWRVIAFGDASPGVPLTAGAVPAGHHHRRGRPGRRVAGRRGWPGRRGRAGRGARPAARPACPLPGRPGHHGPPG